MIIEGKMDTDDVDTGLLKMRNFGIKKHKEH